VQKRRLILIIVAYHPASGEVHRLRSCLQELGDDIGYVVVANDYRQSEPVDLLAEQADLFIRSPDNLGYGAAVNYGLSKLTEKPDYIAALNTDLSWQHATFESIIQWLDLNPDVSLATPAIVDQRQQIQYLCKRNPTILALFSRRFWPKRLKPAWLRRYDDWYVMLDHDYSTVFSAPYLSGCCMVMRCNLFIQAGGFDETYFLYLEDADLTRSMSRYGQCVHFPDASVVHDWGRGNYRSVFLALVNLKSAWTYFLKWGLSWY
jgi:GT2 family glycosyltransferase